MIFVMVFLIPFFRDLKLISVYEYLEMRFDRRVRLVMSGVFLLSRGLGTGITPGTGLAVTSLCTFDDGSGDADPSAPDDPMAPLDPSCRLIEGEIICVPFDESMGRIEGLMVMGETDYAQAHAALSEHGLMPLPAAPNLNNKLGNEFT